MVKADDKVDYDGEKQKFTYFEELTEKVNVLIQTIDQHAEILRQANLIQTKENDAEYFDNDRVYGNLSDL